MEKTKNILIAPDSFKESLSAFEVARAIEVGFSKIFPSWNYIKIPMADGGEGTVQSIVDATAGELKQVTVTNPLREKIKATFGISGDGQEAIIEMAAASGLELIDSIDRDPMIATSWGLGDLISAALDYEVKEIIIGIGGSATNDGGAGMIQRLGGKLLDQKGASIPLGGSGLAELHSIDLSGLDARLKNVKIEVASDVNNPLIGKNGATHIYGPQKGASPEQIEILDNNLAHFGKVIEKELSKNIIDLPGAGAAGGVGAALVAFLNADLRKGGELVTELLDLEEKVQKADLVITGEGGLNHQTIYGKTPIVVAGLAKKYNLPVLMIAGSILKGHEAVYDEGIDAAFSVLTEVTDEATALENAYKNVVITARNVAATLALNLR